MRPNFFNVQDTSEYCKTNAVVQNPSYIQLEIKAITLERLLREENIVIEELRGLNRQAKQLAWKTMLQSVSGH